MIRLQDNVSENYINQSRDFQMLCRLYDCINNGVRFDIDSMIYIFNPMAARNTILKLLAARVGFFPSKELDDMMLRYIISTFPYTIKRKGTEAGIKACIDTVLKARNTQADYTVIIDNDSYTINIIIDKAYDAVALEEYLQFIIPTGYITTLSIAQGQKFETTLEQVNIINIYVDPNSAVSQVVEYTEDIALPTYSIQIVTNESGAPIAYSKAGFPDISTQVLENGITEITYKYFEKDDGVIHQKVMTLNIPPVDNNRYYGDILRSEVIGSNNDATFKSQFIYSEDGDYKKTQAAFETTTDGKYKKWSYSDDSIDTIDSVTGRDKSDFVELWPEKVGNVNVHITKIFDDLFEQNKNRTLIFNTIDSSSLFNFEQNVSNEKILLSSIDVAESINLENIINSDFPPCILDIYGTLAVITGLTEIDNSETGNTEYYACYDIIQEGVAPENSEEEDNGETN